MGDFNIDLLSENNNREFFFFTRPIQKRVTRTYISLPELLIIQQP